MKALKKIKHNLRQLFICFSQLLCVIVCTLIGEMAWADLTMSAKACLWEDAGKRSWPRKFIDVIFFFDGNHCRTSVESERLGRQLPPELRGLKS